MEEFHLENELMNITVVYLKIILTVSQIPNFRVIAGQPLLAIHHTIHHL